jgi:hypothetical protein
MVYTRLDKAGHNMHLIIKGKLNLSNYFSFMVLSTIVLVGVVVASSVFPFDKTNTALLMAGLSIISLGSSMKIITILSRESE